MATNTPAALSSRRTCGGESFARSLPAHLEGQVGEAVAAAEGGAVQVEGDEAVGSHGPSVSKLGGLGRYATYSALRTLHIVLRSSTPVFK